METNDHDVKDPSRGDLDHPISCKQPRYTLAELVAACDPSRPVPPDILEWDLSPPVGNELL